MYSNDFIDTSTQSVISTLEAVASVMVTRQIAIHPLTRNWCVRADTTQTEIVVRHALGSTTRGSGRRPRSKTPMNAKVRTQSPRLQHCSLVRTGYDIHSDPSNMIRESSFSTCLIESPNPRQSATVMNTRTPVNTTLPWTNSDSRRMLMENILEAVFV